MKFLFLISVLLALKVSGANDVRFVAFGDWGMGNSGQATVAKGLKQHCSQDRCDFIIGLGDNFYPDGVASTTDPFWEERYEKMYGGLNIPFYASLGNHDYRGNVQAQLDYSNISKSWTMPARYFTFKKDTVEFFVVDTNDFSPSQRSWLVEKLKGSSATWKIVYGHHPIYSYGAHGDTPALRDGLLPAIKNLADFYVSGHDHDNQVLKPDGGLNFVIAGAGAENRGSKRGARTVWSSDALGFAYFAATKQEMHLEMIDARGEVIFDKKYRAKGRVGP